MESNRWMVPIIIILLESKCTRYAGVWYEQNYTTDTASGSLFSCVKDMFLNLNPTSEKMEGFVLMAHIICLVTSLRCKHILKKLFWLVVYALLQPFFRSGAARTRQKSQKHFWVIFRRAGYNQPTLAVPNKVVFQSWNNIENNPCLWPCQKRENIFWPSALWGTFWCL